MSNKPYAAPSCPVCDYANILERYMRHVMDCEGISHLDTFSCGEIEFTKFERRILNLIEAKVRLVSPKPAPGHEDV